MGSATSVLQRNPSQVKTDKHNSSGKRCSLLLLKPGSHTGNVGWHTGEHRGAKVSERWHKHFAPCLSGSFLMKHSDDCSKPLLIFQSSVRLIVIVFPRLLCFWWGTDPNSSLLHNFHRFPFESSDCITYTEDYFIFKIFNGSFYS